MPSTRKRAPAPPESVEEEAEEQEHTVALQFNEPLTWRAGRAIPVAELLRRLQALSNELRALEQEEASRDSLVPVAKELCSNNLLQHKDRGVRAWTACCLVDMFRLCAPDAPFSGTQLKEIFNLFVSTIFPTLADPSNPYNSQHLYVLKSLADVKSIVLITDIPSAADLIERLFTCCFDILSGPSKAASGEELSKNVEHNMTVVLSVLIEESQGLSSEVLDVILAQFLRADPDTIKGTGSKAKKTDAVDDKQSTLLLKEAPPAYNMAKNVCNASEEKMARYVIQYFSSIIMDTASISKPSSKSRPSRRDSSALDESDDEISRSFTAGDMSETLKAHKLLRELWRSCPTVLSEIIPQLEEELSADDPNLRILATETLSDMVSGIGAAGPPSLPKLNPAAFPSQSLADPSDTPQVYNFLTTPNSPYSFLSRHPQVYESLLNRRNDRSPAVRAAWTTGVGRIVLTWAGGVGLDPEESQRLLRYLAEMLVDGDERVRLAAVKVVERFTFEDLIQKLGAIGGINDKGSVLSNLADRVKDRKPAVHTEAMKLLAKIWGVAAGAIAEGSERVSTLLGPIPSKILDAYYINDKAINVLVDIALNESLLPLGFPPVKPKTSQATNGASKRKRNGQGDDANTADIDPDRIRTERMLILIKSLEPKAKSVFFSRQKNRPQSAKFMTAFLDMCEEYNGGVMEKGKEKTKASLDRLIDFYAQTLPDVVKATEDLWKFAKSIDRRNYHLIRFSMAPDSDYRKVYKAIKELSKRIEESSINSSVLNTLMPLIYRSSLLFYNRSHVPAIIDFSRTDAHGLGATAHEVLKEISANAPEVFKAHIKDLCQALTTEAPQDGEPNSATAVDNLKACAGFAKRFPKEVPIAERKFIAALLAFADRGTPPKAAKHAVSIIMHCAPNKALRANDILKKCIEGLDKDPETRLSKLAALSQLILLGSSELKQADIDRVIELAIKQLLPETNYTEPDSTGDWQNEPDEYCASKIWALKILVNRVRSCDDKDFQETASRVHEHLMGLITRKGALSSDDESPEYRRSRLRLTAAQLLLKMCTSKRYNALMTPADFNNLAITAQDPLARVRGGFVNNLMKYLGQDRLNPRFYTVIFLLAFEPEEKIKSSASTWMRARASAYQKKNDTTVEGLFARFISLLAHHPDFDRDVDNLKDFVQYILFYLNTVATRENLSLIYHVAQRVKSVQDGIDASMSDNLYCLSDLSQAVIRRFEEVKGWSMQAYPGRHKMPAGIFAPLPSHAVSQQIATAQYAPNELLEDLDDIVKDSMRPKKVGCPLLVGSSHTDCLLA
jgi:sister chromatid cohesion protein PDS5